MLECPFCDEDDDWGWDDGLSDIDNQGIDWLTCPNCGRAPGKADIQVKSPNFKFKRNVNNMFKHKTFKGGFR